MTGALLAVKFIVYSVVVTGQNTVLMKIYSIITSYFQLLLVVTFVMQAYYADAY